MRSPGQRQDNHALSHNDVKALQKGRSGLLDCIRAVAITLVVFFHVAVEYPGAGGAFEQFFMTYGSKGVDIFFPLSGFLISSFLLQSDRPDFIKVFFLRRAFRILPLYLVAVTLAAAAMMVTGIDLWLIDRIWINYSFLTAWFIHFQGPGVVPYTITWSLSVEEFAYVLFGLVALVSRRALPWVLIALSVLPAFLKYWHVSQGLGFYFLPVARIDSIAIGGVTAWLMISGRRPLLWLGAALMAGHALALTGEEMRATLGLIILALWTSVAIVLFRTRLRGVGGPVVSVGAILGFYSYFIYLFHVFVIAALFEILPRLPVALPDLWAYLPFWAVASACLAMTYAAAWLSYRWFEGPLMRFGRSLEGRGGPAPEAALPVQPETGEGRVPEGAPVSPGRF